MSFECEINEAYVYWRGGTDVVGRVDGAVRITWNRIRDDISAAEVTVTSGQCCELLNQLATVTQELHIFRGGRRVWRGVLTRIEWGRDESLIVAQDMLWVASRSALVNGYDHAYPNIADAGAVMLSQLNDCYTRYGDPWRMAGHVVRVIGRSQEARTSRATKAYSTTVWEDVDSFAEDGGMDYSLVDDMIYIFDTHTQLQLNPALSHTAFAGWPEVVEYGNELATRHITTNNSGGTFTAGIATLPAGNEWLALYGIIDMVSSKWSEAAGQDDANAQDGEVMVELSERQLGVRAPAPTRVRLPAGTRLLPDSPWDMDDLVPGARFDISVTELCRPVIDRHKLDEVVVEEAVDTGESIAITSSSVDRATEVLPL